MAHETFDKYVFDSPSFISCFKFGWISECNSEKLSDDMASDRISFFLRHQMSEKREHDCSH